MRSAPTREAAPSSPPTRHWPPSIRPYAGGSAGLRLGHLARVRYPPHAGGRARRREMGWPVHLATPAAAIADWDTHALQQVAPVSGKMVAWGQRWSP